MGVGGERHAPAALPPRVTRHPFVKKAAWVPEPFSTSAENLASTGIRSPDRRAVASRYTDYGIPAHNNNNNNNNI